MYEVKIREGGQNGFEIDFAAAVVKTMGADGEPSIVVTAVDEDGKSVFGMQAEVSARRIKYGQDSDAEVTIGGIKSHSPEVAMIRAQCYMLAAQIAAAANAAAMAR